MDKESLFLSTVAHATTILLHERTVSVKLAVSFSDRNERGGDAARNFTEASIRT
jgi:hypothetical protein